MGKIEGIRIENYGSLKSVVLGKVFSEQKNASLSNLVTIIGPSGTGKSSLADAFGFISDCIEKDVEKACDLNNRGGFDRLVSKNTGGPIKFELYYRETSNSRPITYELVIGLDEKNRPFVLEERLRQRPPKEKHGRPKTFLYLRKGVGYVYVGKVAGADEESEIIDDEGKVKVHLSDPRKLGISIYGIMSEYTRIMDFLDFLKSWYLCYFSPDATKQEQMAAPEPYLNRTGSNLNNVAHYMHREDATAFQKALAGIQGKIRGIQEIKPAETVDKRIVLSFSEKGFDAPFYWTRMSDGTLKLFAYYLLLNEHTPRQLVFIEEPENGLYHQFLSDLAYEFQKAVGTGYKKQLFVTTHSPFFINALKPEDVWVLEKGDDGFSTVKRASEYPAVKAMYAENVPLGDLWYSTYFG